VLQAMSRGITVGQATMTAMHCFLENKYVKTVCTCICMYVCM
jgi:hypothetical protein